MILRKIIVEAAELASDIDFIWHGGEPLLQEEFLQREHYFSE